MLRWRGYGATLPSLEVILKEFLRPDMGPATSWPAFGTGLPENLVKGGVTVGGVFDLEPVRLCFLNDILGLDEMMARLESPIHNLPVGQVSLVVAVGE